MMRGKEGGRQKEQGTGHERIFHEDDIAAPSADRPCKPCCRNDAIETAAIPAAPRALHGQGTGYSKNRVALHDLRLASVAQHEVAQHEVALHDRRQVSQ